MSAARNEINVNRLEITDGDDDEDENQLYLYIIYTGRFLKLGEKWGIFKYVSEGVLIIAGKRKTVRS